MGQAMRYAVFLEEEDWRKAVEGFSRRAKRFSAAARRKQISRVSDAIGDAESDSIPDGKEMRYVMHLAEEDWEFFALAVMHPGSKLGDALRERVSQELGLAEGEATEV
ncbi:hypothetical protein [Streptomyces sp. NPDC051561]|uniref:hypothetical protein n=1 Tax=Streptomyces sp. NPDC051561 TaxID=3365658 RepID=UPI0037B01E5B